MEKQLHPNTPHCESCGTPNPDTHRNDGYTECCNELVCHGPDKHYTQKWKSEDGKMKVVACCGFHAQIKFEALGYTGSFEHDMRG